MSAPSLALRLASLSADELRALVGRLANDSEAIAARIDYLTRRETAVQGIALGIARVRADDRSVGYNDVADSANIVRGIAEDIERDVLPRMPVRALALTEQLMALDAPLMDRALDTGMYQVRSRF